MKRTLVLAVWAPWSMLTILAASCPGGGPGPVPPTPTPPPSSMVVHVQGGRFLTADGKDPRILGTIIGCQTEGVSGWPLICPEAIDAIANSGLNWTHVRTGPFTAEGEAPEFAFYVKVNGKYDLTKVNADFIGLLRTRIAQAGRKQVYVEVDLPVDRWVRQHGARDLPNVDPWSARNNLQGEEHGGLSIFQASPDSVHEAAIREVVSKTCEFGNVIYSAGNEAFKSDSGTFTGRLVQIVREICPNRPIGSNSPEGAAVSDFTILHQRTAPQPPANGHPIEVNEYDDPGPTPNGVIAEAIKADSLKTYYHYWRGGHTTAQWLATMTQLGKIRAGQPGPTPAPAICPRPDFEDTRWNNVCRRKGDMGRPFCPPSDQQVFAQQMATAQSHVTPPSTNAGESEIVAYLDAIASDFQHQGVCAWHDHDAVMAQRTETEWHELHPWNFSGGTVLPPEQAFIAKWTGPGQPLPGPPPPTPQPTPGPTPTPSPGACPIPAPGDDWIGDLKPESGQNLDLTVWVGNPTHTKDQPWIGCLPRRCPLAAEKGDVSLACQLALWGPSTVFSSSGGICTLIPRENGFTVKVAEGACALFAKGTVPSAALLGPWEGHATPTPSCNVGPNGLCH